MAPKNSYRWVSMVSGTEAKIIVCRGIWDPRTCEKENTDIALNWKSYFSNAGGYSFENTSYMYVEMCLLFLPAAKNTWQEPCVTLGCLRESKNSIRSVKTVPS